MFIDRGTVLLALARSAIARSLNLPAPRTRNAWWLLKPGASFVTLTRDGSLRGCVGTVRSHRLLLNDVKLNAVAAASRDPRFTPLKHNELASVLIEVSVLSALETIDFDGEKDAIAQLRPRIDGVLMEYRGKRGTFLPQVWEVLPAREEFFAQLKIKTSLPRNFCADDLKLWRYTVSKWKENELQAAA
ncbi:MAG: AmmeMemoRadiSam system protein A [Burkholderiales bacterium]